MSEPLHRTLTLAMEPGGRYGLTIDGREFDHDRIDTEVSHGSLEESPACHILDHEDLGVMGAIRTG
ncbi:hypothetical protein [Agromyces lapidis]|uniref:Uncharacterized protein n=1 Tax=Agromyces lapidis TaxID=279574 RepID=A0ABV5SUE1_9MICO|nr:hypothetical protein [Agromyces lapidis]